MPTGYLLHIFLFMSVNWIVLLDFANFDKKLHLKSLYIDEVCKCIEVFESC